MKLSHPQNITQQKKKLHHMRYQYNTTYSELLMPQNYQVSPKSESEYGKQRNCVIMELLDENRRK